MNKTAIAQRAKTTSSLPPRQGILQRKCACGNHAMAGRECAECGKKKQALQRASFSSFGRANESAREIPPIVHEVLRSPGQPLDAETRTLFEPRCGQDFSHVRVHTDARAVKSAQAVNALAYTVGQDVVFGGGEYAPGTKGGQRLLAHELTHVVQQQGRSQFASKSFGLSTPYDPAEREADTVAESIVAGRQTPMITPSPMSVQRDVGWSQRGPDPYGTVESPWVEEEKPLEVNPQKQTENKACTRTILSEGTCEFLAKNSSWSCCDPENGIEDKSKTTSKGEPGKECLSQKWTPIFTCDSTCEKALAKGCNDADNWMAIPGDQFARSKCGDIYTICANGNQTTGYVRDKSVTAKSFEVSPGIQNALGVTVGSSFKGSIYRPGVAQTVIDADGCCKST